MIEMLVVIGIFTILTSVVMFQYGNFNSQTILTNMTYEVALATRQAQVFSLGVRGEAGETNFDNRYGVYFDFEDSPDGKAFVFFIDRGDSSTDPVTDPDSICNGLDNDECFACETGSECLESYSFLRDIRIESICLSYINEPISDEGVCEDDGDETASATITFERPNPDAIFYNLENDSLGFPDPYQSAAIFVTNDFGDRRAVVVKSTGQIEVKFLNN